MSTNWLMTGCGNKILMCVGTRSATSLAGLTTISKKGRPLQSAILLLRADASIQHNCWRTFPNKISSAKYFLCEGTGLSILLRFYYVLMYKSKWFLQVWFWRRCLGMTIVICNSPIDIKCTPKLWVFVWKRIGIKWRLAICKFSK